MSKTMRILGAVALTAALFGATTTAAHASTTDVQSAQDGTLRRVPCSTPGSVVFHSDLPTCWVGKGTQFVRLYNVDFIYTGDYHVSAAIGAQFVTYSPSRFVFRAPSTVTAITLS